MLVEYDGSAFQGFQIQSTAPTIQAELERSLRIVLRESVRVQCCGRTDAGVHATGQVVHFDTSVQVPESFRFCHALNALLPATISVREAAFVPQTFHARFSCLAREYEFLIWNGSRRRAIASGHSLWQRESIDLEFCNRELNTIIGEHDFAAFTRAVYQDEVTIRYIDVAEMRRVYDPLADSEELIIFRVRANAFLHNMIRILLGSLLDIASGRLKRSMAEILATRDRTKAGQTVAPVGLYFRHAYYAAQEIDVDWLPTLHNYPFRRAPIDGP